MLVTQFVLLNVVVAVLMKHLEDAKEEIPVTSLRAGELENPVTTRTGEEDRQDGQGNQGVGDPVSGPNKKATCVISVSADLHRQRPNDSESSLSSFEYTVKSQPTSASPRHRLPPVSKTQSSCCTGQATQLRLPPIGSQSRDLNEINGGSEKIDSFTSELPEKSPESVSSESKSTDGHVSPRAPIYVMSEDSTEIYDSNMEVDREPSKVFRPVENRQAPRTPSPHSSSEEEGKKKFFKKPFRKSETKRNSSKIEPEAAVGVPDTKPAKQGKQEIKLPKHDAQWASPVTSSNVQQQKGQEIQLNPVTKPAKDEEQDKSYQVQSYV